MKPRHAIEASNQSPVAMNFRERLLPGLPVQVIDVLRDHEAQHSQFFHFHQREVARIRPGNRKRFEKFVVAFAEPLFPRFFRIGHEALKAVHRRLAVLGPQPARPAKRRDPAFDGHSRARERDRIPRRQDHPRAFANFLVARFLACLCHWESALRAQSHILSRAVVRFYNNRGTAG